MQLGFVIDHSRCIGCHACTVACKSENEVPLGSFRTWVKYTEQGSFPQVKRSFAVLRCNQCTAAPCVTICPVKALEKRPDGIVDIDPAACIGCKACMQGCPYDALYINEDSGTAQKCHFCAHRTEQGLAPACAVVCPTEAIIPGDFHDPESRVSRLRAEQSLSARKVEAGTGPNVFYKEVSEAGIDPSLTNMSSGYLWSQTQPGPQLDAQVFESLEDKAQARTTYDVAHQPLWGWKITGYLFLKSIAAGVGLAGAFVLPPLAASHPGWAPLAVPLLGLLFLGLTSGLLVMDLKRPERFLKILLRPNWSSWMARGSFILMAYGFLLTAWLGAYFAWWTPRGAAGWLLWSATLLAAALSAAYTGWLFAQAKGRPLWMQRGLWLHLVVQALVAGAASLLLLLPLLAWLDGDAIQPAHETGSALRFMLLAGLGAHLLFILSEGWRGPRGRDREYARAHRLLLRGPFSQARWLYGIVGGILLPPVLLIHPGPGYVAWAAAGLLALVGLWFEEDGLVRAGQAIPIS